MTLISFIAISAYLILIVGEVSFGQQAFFGIGAYITASSTALFGLDIVIALFIAFIVSAFFALVLSFLTVRLSGLYFAVASLSFAELFRLSLYKVDYTVETNSGTTGPNGPEGFQNIRWIFENNISPENFLFISLLSLFALILLLIIATYRLTDIVMGPMANPFYIDMGYSLSEIGYVVKVVALVGTIIGVFAGGVLIKKMGLYKSLLIGAFLVMFTNLFYSYAAINDKNLSLLGLIVASDSLAAGIVGTVNITFLTSLVSSKYTGFQYALLTSLMAFLGKIFGGFSGVFVENFQSLYGFSFGWMSFYIFTSLLALPAILLIFYNKNLFDAKYTSS